MSVIYVEEFLNILEFGGLSFPSLGCQGYVVEKL
jgi:hypothetical protein